MAVTSKPRNVYVVERMQDLQWIPVVVCGSQLRADMFVSDYSQMYVDGLRVERFRVM